MPGKKFVFIVTLAFMAAGLLAGCAKYTLISNKVPRPCALYFGGESKKIIIIKRFTDTRPEEEKKGLTKRTKKILSFATSDKLFKESIDTAITQRIKNKIELSGFNVVSIKSLPYPAGSRYVLSGEIRHFQAVMRWPNISVVPYLGTAASVITKDEFNIVVAIKASLKDIAAEKVLFDQNFQLSKDIDLPAGFLNLARFKRGLNYKAKLLDLALDDVLEQITEKATFAIEQEDGNCSVQ